MIPITIEGISQEEKKNLQSIQDKDKPYYTPPRCTLIHNSTYNIVEMYVGEGKWIEITPNRRINMLPDSVVSTTGLVVSENGDVTVKLNSLGSIETFGNHKVSQV
jgi:hypothetical protein